MKHRTFVDLAWRCAKHRRAHNGKEIKIQTAKKENRKPVEEAEESGGGMLMGMRSGFKKTAKAVAGAEKKKTTWLDFFLNILLLGAVVFLLYRMFFR